MIHFYVNGSITKSKMVLKIENQTGTLKDLIASTL